MTHFRLGDPVTIRRNGVPVPGHIWGHTFPTANYPDTYDVRTDTGVVASLLAGDVAPRADGVKLVATHR